MNYFQLVYLNISHLSVISEKELFVPDLALIISRENRIFSWKKSEEKALGCKMLQADVKGTKV